MRVTLDAHVNKVIKMDSEKQKKDKSADIARDRTTKMLSRFVENMVVPSKAFQGLRDTLRSGSERNTKRFFEKTTIQLFHMLYTAYDHMGAQDKIDFHETLCSMYPVDHDKIRNHMKGQAIIAEAEAEAEADVEQVGPNVMLVTPKEKEKPVDQIEPVAIKSKWAKTLHLRVRGELVTLCSQKLANKELRKKHDNLTICKRCQKYIREIRKEEESEKKEA